MKNYLQETLGCEVYETDYIVPSEFPMYLKNDYLYKIYVIENVKCLAVKPYDFSLSSFKKQRSKITELSGMPVVLVLDSITKYQRKALIVSNIPFVVKDMQIYLPFLAISLTEKYSKKVEKIEKFSPSTQLVFLYIYYNKVCLPIAQLANVLGYSIVTINRAYKDLNACGLLKYHKEGRNNRYEIALPYEKLLNEAEQYMISPVLKMRYFTDKSICKNYLKAGLYALSEKSMIGINKNEICYYII